MSVSSAARQVADRAVRDVDDEEIGLRVGLHRRGVRGALKRDEPPVGRRRELRGGAIEGRNDPWRAPAGVNCVEQRLCGREIGFFDVASPKEERAAVGGVGRLQLADPRAVELASGDGLAPGAHRDEIDAAVARPSRYPAPSARNVARVMTRTSLGLARPGSAGAGAGRPSSRRRAWRCPDSRRIPRRPRAGA